MNLTSSIATMLALSTSQIYIGTYQCPAGQHTIDLNSLTVNKCTAAGSNPNMANTGDANFAILGDPSGGTYIAPTTYVNSGVMFHVLGGRVSAKDIRFNGVPAASGGLPWIAFKLEGDTQTATPTTREFLLEDCEFRYCARAVLALNYENIRIRRNRFEITPDSVNSADASGSTHVFVQNGSQNIWLRDNDYMGGQGIWIDDTYNPGNPSAGWPAANIMMAGENILNAYSGITVLAGTFIKIQGCRIECDYIPTTGKATGFLIDPLASVPSTKSVSKVSLTGNWFGGKCGIRMQFIGLKQLSMVGNQVIGPGGAGGAQNGIWLQNVQDFSISGNLFRGNLTDIKTDANCVGANVGNNYISSGSTIADAGTNGRWQNNRIMFAYSAQNLVPSNSYQAAPTG